MEPSGDEGEGGIFSEANPDLTGYLKLHLDLNYEAYHSDSKGSWRYKSQPGTSTMKMPAIHATHLVPGAVGGATSSTAIPIARGM